MPPRRRAAVIVMGLVTGIITVAAVSQVWTRLRAIEYGYKISKASKRNAELKETNRRLRIEVALLKSPARIAGIASEELGMRHPRPEQIKRLRLTGPPEAVRRPEPLARAAGLAPEEEAGGLLRRAGGER